MKRQAAVILVLSGLAMAPSFAQGGLVWDGRFDPSTLISAIAIVLSIIGSAIWLKADVREAKQDVAEMKPKVARIDILVQQMADGKERMDRIELGYRNEIARLERRIEMQEHQKSK